MAASTLTARTALVTGASRGIGKAIAIALAEAGADVAVNYRRRKDDAAATVAAIEQLGRRSAAFAADVSDARDIAAMVASVEKALGPIDILVNNAGTEEVCPSEEVSPALWDRIVDTNLKGTFFVTQAVAAGMLARQSGAIVNLCSLTSYVGVPTAVPYGSSKSGLLGMTRALAAEWGPRGVRVNAIAPGYFRTGMTEVFYRDPAWAEAMPKATSSVR